MNRWIKSMPLMIMVCSCWLFVVGCSQTAFPAEIVTTETLHETQNRNPKNLQQEDALAAKIQELQALRSAIDAKVEDALTKMEVFIPTDNLYFKYETLNLPLKDGHDQEVIDFVDVEQALFQELAGMKDKLRETLVFLQDDFVTTNTELKSYLQDFTARVEQKLAFVDLTAEMTKIDEAHIIYVPIYQHEMTLRLFRSTLSTQIDEVLAVLGVLRVGF